MGARMGEPLGIPESPPLTGVKNIMAERPWGHLVDSGDPDKPIFRRIGPLWKSQNKPDTYTGSIEQIPAEWLRGQPLRIMVAPDNRDNGGTKSKREGRDG